MVRITSGDDRCWKRNVCSSRHKADHNSEIVLSVGLFYICRTAAEKALPRTADSWHHEVVTARSAESLPTVTSAMRMSGPRNVVWNFIQYVAISTITRVLLSRKQTPVDHTTVQM